MTLDEAKLSWFPLYVRDWLLDEKVMSMTFAERGVYLHLLCLQWLEGSIPASLARLEQCLGLATANALGSQVEIPRLREMVGECFAPHPTLKGRLANPRLLKVLEEQRLTAERRKAAGSRGGRSRAQAGLKPGSRESESKTDIKTLPSGAAAVVRESLPNDEDRDAFDGLLKSSSRPDAFAATVRALGPGGLEHLGEWDDVGRALRDAAAAPGTPSANFLRGCVRKAKQARQEPTTASLTPAEEVRKLREAAEREDAA